MSKAYQFGPFRLDAARRRLFRGNEMLAVAPKALDVLEALLENRGRTVDKEYIVARVWPDTMVEEANLTQSIYILRRALGDEPSEPRYISTVARRGYRFVGSASEVKADSAPDDRSRAHGTSSVSAYHAYLRARHHWAKRDTDGLRAAIALFRQAIDFDPTYAGAYVGLAECYVLRWGHGWTTAEDAVVTAKAAARRALDIDDTIAEAHATIGVLQMMQERDWNGAEQSFRRALELASDYPTTHNWYANYLAARGRSDAAVDEAQKAMTLDPLNLTWQIGVGHMLLLGRRYPEAVEAQLKVLETDDRFWLAHWVLGMALEQVGALPRAVESLRRADEFSGGNPMARGVFGRILALSGRIDDARGLLADLTNRRAREAAPADTLGIIHAALGEVDAAFEWFERAAAEGSYLLSFLNVSPIFDPLRSDRRFATLQRALRLAV